MSLSLTKCLLLFFIVLPFFFFLAKKDFINFSYINMLFMVIIYVEIDQFLSLRLRSASSCNSHYAFSQSLGKIINIFPEFEFTIKIMTSIYTFAKCKIV